MASPTSDPAIGEALPLAAWPWWILAFALSATIVWLAIAYAHRRGMLDTPGRRRSHTMPTPRGGGIGLVVGALLSAIGVWAYSDLPALPGAAAGIGCAAVALIGWVDDHRSLSVVPRLLVQLAAVALFSWAFVHWLDVPPLWLLPLVFLGTASINLHNFMDGIDGLLAGQLVFVGAGCAALGAASGHPGLAALGGVLASAALGFGLFNRPPARIFMGDVGSGTAGMMVFVLVALGVAMTPSLLWPLLALVSAFYVDAGLTLASRMLLGRRWYTAHREHLYQWLVRSGRSHARVSGLYLMWNLLVCAPVAGAAFLRPALGPWLCAGLYAASAFVWWSARRRCLQRVRQR